MEKEIKYKGKTIKKLFPSGYYEVYSDKQERFLKFDELDDAKSLIDSESSMAAGGGVKPYLFRAGDRYKYLHGKGTVEYLSPSKYTKGDYLFIDKDGEIIVVSEDELSTSISEIKSSGDSRAKVGKTEIMKEFSDYYASNGAIITGGYFPDMECGGYMAKGGSADLLNKVRDSGQITENEINLIKNRLNNNRADAETKELVQWIWDNQPELTEDQNKKGLDFLMKQWKTPTGKVKESSPYGYREEEVLETFTGFQLAGFHDISKYGGREFYVPLYDACGKETCFQYYYDGKVQIIG